MQDSSVNEAESTENATTPHVAVEHPESNEQDISAHDAESNEQDATPVVEEVVEELTDSNGLPMMLPSSCIARCIKSKLSGVGVSKDAKEEFSKALHIFLLFLTNSAQESCAASKRQTIGASDVNKALEEIDFEAFIPQIDAFIKEQKKKAAAK